MKVVIQKGSDSRVFRFDLCLGKVTMTIDGGSPIHFICGSEKKIADQVLSAWLRKGYKTVE